MEKTPLCWKADGSPMSVHNALIHINKAIDEYFTQAEGEMDAYNEFIASWHAIVEESHRVGHRGTQQNLL